MIRVPRRICMYDGIAVRDLPLWKFNDVKSSHKTLLCDTVSEVVCPGCRVVEVGSGRGLATVTAARAGGRVMSYEAAGRMVERCRETVRINRVDDAVTVAHAVVGPAYEVFGDAAGAAVIDPASVSADVLLLDCEGAELAILEAATFDVAVVETHPEFGAETSDVLGLLDDAEIVGADPHDGHVVVGG